MDVEMVINRGEAPDEALANCKSEFVTLKKLDGAISKKKRKKTAVLLSAAEQAARRSKIQPIIIHAVSPPLIHAEPSTFMRIVQSWTGCEATRLRCEDEEEEEAALNRAGSPMSCGSPAATTVQRPWKGGRCAAAATAMQAHWVDEAVGSPVSLGRAVGSPCSSTTSTTTVTTCGDVNLDANDGFMGRFEELIAENEVFYVESRDEGAISSPPTSAATSADGSCCRLLLDSNEHHGFFNSAGASAAHEQLFLADSDVHPQDLESNVDSYLAHLLSSYDRDAYCKFTCTSALLADVSDPLLL